jgi:hypothetical protein
MFIGQIRSRESINLLTRNCNCTSAQERIHCRTMLQMYVLSFCEYEKWLIFRLKRSDFSWQRLVADVLTKFIELCLLMLRLFDLLIIICADLFVTLDAIMWFRYSFQLCATVTYYLFFNKISKTVKFRLFLSLGAFLFISIYSMKT